jgi:hypothetical protein
MAIGMRSREKQTVILNYLFVSAETLLGGTVQRSIIRAIAAAALIVSLQPHLPIYNVEPSRSTTPGPLLLSDWLPKSMRPSCLDQ